MKKISDVKIIFNVSNSTYEIVLKEELKSFTFKNAKNILSLNFSLLEYICKELNIDHNKFINEKLAGVMCDNRGILEFLDNDCESIKACMDLVGQYMLLAKLSE